MIQAAFLMLVTQVQVTPRVIEVPQRAADHVVVQIWAKADLTGPRDRAAWKVLAATLLKGTGTFSDFELVKYGAQAGVAPKVTCTEDTMKIEVGMPKTGLDLAVNIASSLAEEAILRDEDLDAARAALAYPEEPWRQAMDPWLTDSASLKNDDVRNLYHRVFQPGQIVVVVGGEFEEGKGKSEVFDRFRTYTIAEPDKSRMDVSHKMLVSSGAKFGIHALFGKPMTPSSPGAAARILATVAAGVGKDCSLYRVIRESKGLAYEVRGLFWPTAKGWSPRFVAFRASTAEPKGLAMTFEIMSALREDSAQWDAATLERAKAVARMALVGQFTPSPFQLGPGSAMKNNLTDRCDWQGYWSLVSNTVVPRETLIQTFENVDLAQLKAAALQLADESQAVTLPASG